MEIIKSQMKWPKAQVMEIDFDFDLNFDNCA